MLPVRAADGVARGARRDPLAVALWAATLIWVIGMATLFPLGNERLDAISVFTFDRIAFLIVAALLAMVVARTPAMLRAWGGVEVAMAVYLLVVAASWTWTIPHKDLIDLKRDVNLLLTNFLMPYTAFLIARHAGWSRWQVRTTISLLVLSIGAYLVVVGLIQGLIDWRFLVAEADQSVHRSRARGPFPNAIAYSAMLAVLVPAALVLYADEQRRSRRVVLAVLCVGLIEALVLSQVRIVWLALPAALFYLAATHAPARRPALVVGVGVLAAVMLAWLGVDLGALAGPEGAAAQRSVAERLAEAGPAYNRIAVWATGLNMVVHRPLFGFGFGARTFLDARQDYYTSCCGVDWRWAVECHVPHNELLNVLILLGAVGLLVYLGLLRELWRLLSSGRSASADSFLVALAAGVQATFLLLVLVGQLHDVMYFAAVQVVFFFLAGCAGAGHRDGHIAGHLHPALAAPPVR